MTQKPEFGIIHLAYFQNEDFEHYLSIRDIEDDTEEPAMKRLKPLNKNMYEHLMFEDEEEYQLQKQMEEFDLIEKMEKLDIHEEAEYYEEEQ